MQKIWTFNFNEYIETDHIDLSKTFKASGKFYDDIETLCKLFNLKVHPALRPISYGEKQQVEGQPPVEEDRHKDLNTLTFYKHRIDKNSMKVLFLSLPASPGIHTLKYY